MAWIAVVLALVALPVAVLDVRSSLAMLAGAAAAAVFALSHGHGVWPARGALAIALVGVLLIGWEVWDLRRPFPGTAPSVSSDRNGGQDREVLLPLRVDRAPITRLALLQFADDGDSVYEGLEPQFIDRGAEQGIRIIGYRHDGHVDLYDDLTLTPEPEEESRVTGRGRLTYRHTDLGRPILEVDDQSRIHVEFSFVDVEGRRITAGIHERTTRRSTPMNLLAPVGSSAADPEYFPLFLMHDFEFIRLGGSDLDVHIDDRPVTLAGFPVPLPIQGQWRSFAKYTTDSEIIAVFPTGPDWPST